MLHQGRTKRLKVIDEIKEMKDTPNSYSGYGSAFLQVRTTEDGIDYTMPLTSVRASGVASDGELVSEQGIREAINAVGDQTVKATYFGTIGAGTTSGTISKPAGGTATFIMDEWGTDTDALVSTIENGKPTFKSPRDASGNVITTTFDTAGNYSLSGTPAPSAEHAIIYVYTCKLSDFNSNESLWEAELIEHGRLAGLDQDDHVQYLLVDGTRAMTGALDMAGFGIPNPGAIGGTTPAAGAFTTLTASSTLGVTGLSTLTGGATLGVASHLLLPLHDDAVTPTLAFGDGDTGIYESSDDMLQVTIEGTDRFYFAGGILAGNTAGAVAIRNTQATATVPNINPNRSDTDTGVGLAAADALSLIAGGVEGIRITEAAAATTTDVTGTLALTKGSQAYNFVSPTYAGTIAMSLESQTSNSPFVFEMFAKDGDGTDYVSLSLYGLGTTADVTNYERVMLQYRPDISANTLYTTAGGSGTVRPLVLYTGSNTNQLYLATNGKVGVGSATLPQLFNIYSNGGNAYMSFNTDLTGQTASDGLTVGIDNAGIGYIWQRENQSLLLGTNNIGFVTLTADQKLGVGVGVGLPDGTLHVHTGSSGVVTADENADDLVVENSATGGISILTPDASAKSLYFGGPAAGKGAVISYSHTSAVFNIGTYLAAANVVFKSGNNVEAVRIDAGQRLLVGHTASVPLVGTACGVQINGTAGNSFLSISRYQNGTGGAGIVLGKTRSTSVGTPGTIVQDNDSLGIIYFAADDGVDFANTPVQLKAEVDDATPAANAIGGAFTISTATTAGVLTEAVRVGSDQRLLTSSMSTLSGNFYLGYADAVNYYLGYLGAVTINSAGNVGIGESSPDEMLHLTSATTEKPIVKIENTADDANSGEIDFYMLRATPADYDSLAKVEGWGNNDAGTPEVLRYGLWDIQARDVTDGDEAGAHNFYALMDGTIRNLLTLSGYNGTVNQGEIVFNEDAQDVDTRIEAVGVAAALKVQGSDGGVFMGGLKSGATQVAAGAAAGELWVTSGHATQEDNTVMMGV